MKTHVLLHFLLFMRMYVSGFLCFAGQLCKLLKVAKSSVVEYSMSG